MVNSVNPANKIFAASYANNLAYYNQSPKRSTVLSRFLQSFQPPDGTPYLEAVGAGMAAFLKSAGQVKLSADTLVKPDTTAFKKRTAASSDTAKVTATAKDQATLGTYRVKVNQIAASQTNSGTLVPANAPSAIGSGMNDVRITTGGKSTTVSTFIHSGDTNSQALSRLKDSINAAKTGVTANIATDTATGHKKLELKSALTGTKQAFTVSDLTGNAAAATGITAVTGAASDAVYSINGGANQTSQTNTIELEKGKVSAVLLKTTTEDVEIKVKTDEAEALKQVKQLLTDYNDMHKRLSEAGGYLNPSVKRSLETVTSGYDSAGIVKKADGTLQLDEEKFKDSLKSRFDQTRNTISGSYGIASRLSKAAERLEAVPTASLMNTKVKNLQQFAAYKSSMNAYLQINPNGWLFDGNF